MTNPPPKIPPIIPTHEASVELAAIWSLREHIDTRLNEIAESIKPTASTCEKYGHMWRSDLGGGPRYCSLCGLAVGHR